MPTLGESTSSDTAALLRSPSIRRTFLFLMTIEIERLAEMNDFPEPGLNDVSEITSVDSFFSVTNSIFVRSTLKASLMTSLLPSLTTIGLVSPFREPLLMNRLKVSNFFFFP